jgi:hypothetical protein
MDLLNNVSLRSQGRINIVVASPIWQLLVSVMETHTSFQEALCDAFRFDMQKWG